MKFRLFTAFFVLLFNVTANAAPTLWHARQACPDRYCVQLVVQNAKPDSYIDVRTVSGGPVLKSFSGNEITRVQRGSYESMTIQIGPDLQASFNSAPEGLLFWIVNPGDGFDGYEAVKRSESRPIAPMYGGSNYSWYRNAGAPNNCNREPYGILKTYHLNDPDNPSVSVRSIVQSQLADMVAAGQRSVRLGIIANYGYEYDSYINVQNGLTPQYKQNLVNWIIDAHNAGFDIIIPTIFADGELDPLAWDAFQAAKFNSYWKTVQDIFDGFEEDIDDRIFSDSFDPDGVQLPAGVLVDLGNELLPRAVSEGAPNTPANPVLSKFARDLWTLYLQKYSPNRSVGFSSYQANIGRAVRHMPYIYQNNFPAALQFHPYSNEESVFQEVDSSMDAIGLTDMPVIIGEVYFNDATTAEGLSKQMDLRNRQIMSLMQWPLIRGNNNCGGVNAIIPMLEFDNYIKHGF